MEIVHLLLLWISRSRRGWLPLDSIRKLEDRATMSVKSMSKLYTTRVANLRRLVEMTEGGAVQVAAAMGYRHRSFISQMAGVNPTRRITEKTARAIEDAMGLVSGWMDIAR